MDRRRVLARARRDWARAAFPELAILSLDASIRRTGIDLGFQLLPGSDKA
jgi:hypothetical protein